MTRRPSSPPWRRADTVEDKYVGEITMSSRSRSRRLQRHSVTSCIIGVAGSYQIHKISIGPSVENGCYEQNNFRLGVNIRVKEEVTKLVLKKAFPKALSYVTVDNVHSGSLAEEAGILPKDILCKPTGAEPVVFHALCSDKAQSEAADSGRGMWELLADETEFSKLLSDTEAFTLYLAREVPKKKSQKKKSTDEGNRGIKLSIEMVAKVRENTATLEEVKADAKNIFEEERAVILADLPAELKDRFGKIGFSQWTLANGSTRKSVDHLPVLIMSPYW
jgi:hypothetical protein